MTVAYTCLHRTAESGLTQSGTRCEPQKPGSLTKTNHKSLGLLGLALHTHPMSTVASAAI